jgi:CDP-glucose 4,6-dehydratase
MANESSQMEEVVSQRDLSVVYKNKKVFVTGHTGFKGSWLVALLHSLGATVKGYALLPDSPDSLFSIVGEKATSNSIIADIRDKQRLQSEIDSFQPDYIFHLAAQPLVRRSYEIPAETFEINLIGTANLLEAVKQLNKKCTVVVVTTDKVYFNKEQNVLYKEEDQLGGYDPYSASKACTELVCESFRNSFFNLKNWQIHKKGLATARAGNVIGGGDWNKDRLMPDIVRSLCTTSVIDVRNPDAVRPWQHVLEPLTGYLQLASLLDMNPEQYGQAYNFGPYSKDHISVSQLVKTAIKHWGEGSWNAVSLPKQPHEAGLLMLNIEKAEKEINWHPKLDAGQSIKWTLDWYKQSAENKAPFTFSQIEKYLTL